jgi:hypothetical protein
MTLNYYINAVTTMKKATQTDVEALSSTINTLQVVLSKKLSKIVLGI